MARLWTHLCAAFCLLIWSGGAGAATDEKRIALVIGIGSYAHAPGLVNPPNDARAIAEQLEKLGFEVDLKLDLDNRALAGALRDFGIRTPEADVALIYYAGHGVQVDGTNYLVPADARLERVRDLLYEAMPLQLFLGELAGARKLGIMMLDACRDNPFVDRLVESMGAARTNQIGAGLGRIDDTPSDTFVAMATRANAVAEDGAGAHSPYAEALLTELQVPGLELSLFFRRVRDHVLRATQGRQEPFTFGSLGATPFYFNPRPPNRDPVVAAAAAVQVLDNAGPTPLAVPAPTDPDEDRLVVQVAGLPRGGNVLVGDRTVLIGDYLTVEQLRSVAFRPDGSAQGDAGLFEYLVTDGQGGSARGAVPVAIMPSNRPPTVAAAVAVQAVINRITVPLPADPDGDEVTVRVRELPARGRVRLRGEMLGPGDRLRPEDLGELTYDAEDAAIGSSERLVLVSEDGRGGEATTTVSIAVTAGAAPGLVAQAAAPEPPAVPVAAAVPAEPPAIPEPVASVPPVAAVPGISLEPMPGSFETTVDANLRARPSAASERVGRVGKGTELTVLGRVAGSNWLHVLTPDGEPAFIAADLVAARAEPPVTPVTPDEAPQVAALAAVEPTSSRTQGNGNGFQDCPNCPVLVRILPGSFTMGSRNGDTTERPAHEVTLAKPFALGKYEVTVAEWRACVDEGGCKGLPRMQEGVTDAMPVHNIHWLEAADYLDWLRKKTGHRYRLPSEAEWEYAARAGTDTAYWWGAEVDGSKVICRECGGSGYDRLHPPEVNAQPANPFGLHGMSGGVAEWLADCWFDDYADAPDDGSVRDAPNCRRRVLRGGSWRDEPLYLKVTARNFYDIDVHYPGNGLRVARDLD